MLLTAGQTVYAGVADGNGHYSISGVAAGTYTLFAMADGYGRNWVMNVGVTAGVSEANVVLGVPATISGKVTFNGQPATDVFILAEMDGNPPGGVSDANTASDGTFTVPDLAQGTYDLTVIDMGDSPTNKSTLWL